MGQCRDGKAITKQDEIFVTSEHRHSGPNDVLFIEQPRCVNIQVMSGSGNARLESTRPVPSGMIGVSKNSTEIRHISLRETDGR